MIRTSHFDPSESEDFVQTFVRGVLVGYTITIGCTAGFLAAIVADRIPFLGRGLLPLGNSSPPCRSSASPLA